MANQKLTHTIEWEPVGGKYRIIKLTGSKRQPTLDEAKQYLQENNLPEEIWCCAFYNHYDGGDGYFDDYEINKTLVLYEYTKYTEGGCPICGQAIDMYEHSEKCPVCGKEWG